MKKILYIDTWVKGYRNFTRIDEEFKKKDFTSLLVHTGSFYDKDDFVVEEKIGNLIVRDISYYKTILIRKVIEIEKPDVVIILNLSFVFDRAIVNVCKSKNIKLVYLSHGKLISPNVAAKDEAMLNDAIWHNLSRIVKKKNVLVLLNYFSSLKGLNIIKNPLKLIFGIIKKPSNYLTYARCDEELNPDLILVYTEDDKTLLSDNYGFQDKKIVVTGNPEITEFLSAPTIARNIFLNTLGFDDNTKYLVYLDDGFANNEGVLADEWYGSLSDIVQATDSLGLKFIMKLHPRTKRKEHLPFFESLGIYSLEDCDFKNLLGYSEFVISYVSTTITYALIFNKNVYIPYWGEYSKLLKNYPDNVVKYCSSLSSFKESITINANDCQENIIAYLLDNGIETKVDSINTIVCEVSKLL